MSDLCAQKDKEDLEEISTELELADEDESVPYVPRPPASSPCTVNDMVYYGLQADRDVL